MHYITTGCHYFDNATPIEPNHKLFQELLEKNHIILRLKNRFFNHTKNYAVLYNRK